MPSEVASVGELKVMKKALEVKCVNVLELHKVARDEAISSTRSNFQFSSVSGCVGDRSGC